jgi:outer membrane beta-barrel protein
VVILTKKGKGAEMNKKTISVTFFLVLFFFSSPLMLRAQTRRYQFTLSPMAGGYVTEGNQEYDSGLVYGMGIGFNFTPHLGAEVMGRYRNFEQKDKFSPYEKDIDGHLLHLNGIYHLLPGERFVPYLSLGGGALKIKDDSSQDKDETVGFADYGAGFNYFITEHIAFRSDAQHIITFDKEKRHNNFSIMAGLNFFIGGEKAEKKEAPPPVVYQDSDNDGVIDNLDRCPGTPQGVNVDAFGCPVDSDKDGVPDYLDECPNTPQGVEVDSKGCPVDSDKDSVPDYKDKCPNTPTGVIVDENGCPMDSDKDSVLDYKDKCPNTPLGVRVDENGCPFDSDRDSVPDDRDRCPNTPLGVKVDENGCPRDSDNDSVPDDRDKCPNTPLGIMVDENGCPIDSDRDSVPDYKDKCPNTPIGAKINESGCWTLGEVLFDVDKWDIRPEGFKELENAIEVMKKNPDLKLEVQGHTDNTGTKAHNDILSNRRAFAIRDYLVEHGISPERLKARGYGFSVPTDTNDTPEGRQKNRRVQFNPL